MSVKPDAEKPRSAKEQQDLEATAEKAREKIRAFVQEQERAAVRASEQLVDYDIAVSEVRARLRVSPIGQDRCGRLADY